MHSRRQFLRLGLVGGALAVAVRAVYGPFSSERSIPEDRGFSYGVLGPSERAILTAIVPVVLAGALQEDTPSRDRAITDVVRGVDGALSGLPPAVQSEIADLFRLLAFPVTRRLLAHVGKPWLDAGSAEVAAFLERWRTHRWALLRTAQRALHELIMAAWYGSAASWRRIDYPGPPILPTPTSRGPD